MKLITRDTDYAVRALCFIAKNKSEVISVSALVKRLKIPRPFLRKILQRLNTEGVLVSYKGQGGGFILGRQPNKIFLVDLIKIFQGKFQLNECIFKKSICLDKSTCILRMKIESIERDVFSALSSITIASLLD